MLGGISRTPRPGASLVPGVLPAAPSSGRRCHGAGVPTSPFVSFLGGCRCRPPAQNCQARQGQAARGSCSPGGITDLLPGASCSLALGPGGFPFLSSCFFSISSPCGKWETETDEEERLLLGLRAPHPSPPRSVPAGFSGGLSSGDGISRAQEGRRCQPGRAACSPRRAGALQSSATAARAEHPRPRSGRGPASHAAQLRCSLLGSPGHPKRLTGAPTMGMCLRVSGRGEAVAAGQEGSGSLQGHPQKWGFVGF